MYACVADIGWITGHSYVVYGPLSNGATTVIFESTPIYPDEGTIEPTSLTPLSLPHPFRSLLGDGISFEAHPDIHRAHCAKTATQIQR